MIEKIYKNKYMIVCDNCGESEDGFDSFDDAAEAKNDLLSEWRVGNYKGEWQDICPECQEG